jgi:hypothetical protein
MLFVAALYKRTKEERLAPFLFLFKTKPSGKYRGKTPAR